MRVTLLTICALFCITLVTAATKKPQVVRFRPITREEYNEIMKITDGKPKITEGRLISSGLAGLTVFKNLVTLTNTLWPNIWSMFGTTPAEAADVAEEQTDSYPLCVLDQDQDDSHHVNYEETRAAPMDCIIVVRDNEEEEEEHYDEEFYHEPIASMMPDYQHWPYAAPQVPPTYPFLSMPYAYPHYQPPFPYYPGFPSFPAQFPQQHSFGHGLTGANFVPGEQQQQQQQQQSDYFGQPNVINPFAINPYQMPFFPTPNTAPVQNNANSGPIVHVIRGDKREFNQKRALKNQRRNSPTKQRKAAEARSRRKVRIVPEEDGYMQVIAPKRVNRDQYSKISLSRAAPQKTPVYIVTADQLYGIR